MKLWKSIIINPNHCLYDLLPPNRTRTLRGRGHNFILPRVSTERFKRIFVNDTIVHIFLVFHLCKLSRLLRCLFKQRLLPLLLYTADIYSNFGRVLWPA